MPLWSKICGLLIVLALGAAGTTYWLKSRLTQHEFTAVTGPQQFILGNDVLDVPLNMTRFASQRTKTVLNQLDLVMYWEDGSGFSEANQKAFLRPNRTPDLIFMTLTERKLHQDMDDRLVPIYSKLLSGKPRSGPAGLVLRPFRAGSGYDGEELAVSDAAQMRWVARCQKHENSQFPTCMRDLFVGNGLSLTYRFSRSLLPQWQVIENRVQEAMKTLVITGR